MVDYFELQNKIYYSVDSNEAFKICKEYIEQKLNMQNNN
jgi:hypothetical protein